MIESHRHDPVSFAEGSLPSGAAFPSRRRLLLTALGLLAAGLIVLPFDLDCSRALRSDWLEGDFHRLILLAEVYGHGMGVAMILLTIWVLHAPSRRALLRLGCCSLGAGLTADVVKLAVARTRPHGLDDDATLSQIFTAVVPYLRLGAESLTHVQQSFPSAHTATAVGLAIGMSRLYPQGRWLFTSFALLAALQRTIVGAHYPSDCLCGAAVGIVVAVVVLDSGLAGRYFDRFESRGTAQHDEQVPVDAAKAA